MNKYLKIVIVIFIILILLLIGDSVMALLFNRSQTIYKRDVINDNNYIDKGLLVNTYYCINSDSITVKSVIKGKKYTCPKSNNLSDFDFRVIEYNKSENYNIYMLNYNDMNYYYGNTNFELRLTNNNKSIDVITAIEKGYIKIDDIYHKAIHIEEFDNETLYEFSQFNIIKCNNKVIIGNKNMKINDRCKNITDTQIREMLNKITSSNITSSNPFTYIENSKDTYNELLNYKQEVFEFSLKELSQGDNSLTNYIEAKLVSDINTSFVCEFTDAKDYLNKYKDYLKKLTEDDLKNNYLNNYAYELLLKNSR